MGISERLGARCLFSKIVGLKAVTQTEMCSKYGETVRTERRHLEFGFNAVFHREENMLNMCAVKCEFVIFP
jgi:hypothetical protein